MRVTHHLTDETLHDYATGSLSQAMEVVVACHLTVCAHCRRRAAMADDVGGGLFDALSSERVSLQAYDLISIARKQAPVQTPSTAINGNTDSAHTSPGKTVAGVPRPLGRMLPAPLDKLKWRIVAPGIRQYRLHREPRQQGAFQLLHLAPGTHLSEHSHSDRELTFLLQGSYVDSLGRYQAGDVADLDGNIEHQPVVDSDVPCIALIATQSPVQYSGMIGKIMQPFVGI